MKLVKSKSKVLLLMVATLMASIVMMSCSNREKLPERKIAKLVNAELADLNLDVKYGDVKVGYYELSSKSERYELRKLAAAGMIEYRVECVLDSTRKRSLEGYRYGYWWDDPIPVYSYRTVVEEHYFVEVKLTAAAKEFVVDTVILNEREPDFPFLRDLSIKYAEDSVVYDEGEVTILNPPQSKAAEPKADYADEAVDSVVEEVFVREELAEPEEEDPVKKVSLYEKTLKKCYENTVHVRLWRMKFNKVSTIRVNPTDGSAVCQCQLVMYEVTPFGRVLTGLKVNDCFYSSPQFVFLQDKGWKIYNLKLETADDGNYNVEKPKNPEDEDEVDEAVAVGED